MAKADIEVTLRGGVEEFGAIQCRPAANLQGTVTIFPDSDVKCNHLFVRLEWHTEGRGTRFREIIDELDVYQGALQGGLPASYAFSFQLPEEPWSYEGHYVSVVWAITVQVDLPWAKDPKHEETFLLLPGSEEY